MKIQRLLKKNFENKFLAILLRILLRTLHRDVHWDIPPHTPIQWDITEYIHELYRFFAAWKFKNLLNLNNTPHSWLNLLSRCLIWLLYFSRVSIKIPRYLELLIFLMWSAPIKNCGRVFIRLLVTTLNSDFERLYDNLLLLHQSGMFRNILFT